MSSAFTLFAEARLGREEARIASILIRQAARARHAITLLPFGDRDILNHRITNSCSRLRRRAAQNVCLSSPRQVSETIRRQATMLTIPLRDKTRTPIRLTHTTHRSEPFRLLRIHTHRVNLSNAHSRMMTRMIAMISVTIIQSNHESALTTRTQTRRFAATP